MAGFPPGGFPGVSETLGRLDSTCLQRELQQSMATTTDIPLPKHKREVIDRAVIRFAGDSGDGMQVTGSQFTNTVALYGNDIATFPDFPAEIRAPAGTLPGVSGYQLHFSFNDI